MSGQLALAYGDRGATLSEGRLYRYALWRDLDWGDDRGYKGTVNWIMLNPSTADESKDDPTIRRCVGFARRWGYGSIVVTNLYGLRATDPRELRAHPWPVGPLNDSRIRCHASLSDLVVVAWGNHGGKRAAEVLALLRGLREPMHERARNPLCLGVTKLGQPVHPLRQPNDAKLVPFVGGEP